MGTRMQQRRGTAAEWTAANPILESGEIGFVRDTGDFKIGDGSTAWNALSYPYLRKSEKAADSNLLDGLDSSAFLLVTGKAADSDKLDGIDSSGFMKTGEGLSANANTTFTGANTFAGGTTFTGALNAYGAVALGDSDLDIIHQRSVHVETHTRNVTNTYTDGKLTQVIERAGSTIVRTTTLNYTGDTLTSTVEAAGGKTITTTLNYTDGVLTGTTRTVA